MYKNWHQNGNNSSTPVHDTTSLHDIAPDNGLAILRHLRDNGDYVIRQHTSGLVESPANLSSPFVEICVILAVLDVYTSKYDSINDYDL
jgi:hypothetical protein